jgi:hypothetical protein
MTPRQALAFIRKHGVVLEAAQGPVPQDRSGLQPSKRPHPTTGALRE